jgi:Predicted 3'-5' exonuclease related to the exonuclease domain of PolB
LSDRKFKPLPPDPFRHQDSAIAPISGSEVEKYYHAGRMRQIAKYCENDVVNTYRVWLRYELFCGRLTDREFAASEAILKRFITNRDAFPARQRAVKDMQYKLAESMAKLLAVLPVDLREEVLNEVRDHLRWAEGDIGVTSAHSNDPNEFARELFVRTPAGRILAERAMENRYNPRRADSPADLVLRFLKSDGHPE